MNILTICLYGIHSLWALPPCRMLTATSSTNIQVPILLQCEWTGCGKIFEKPSRTPRRCGGRCAYVQRSIEGFWMYPRHDAWAFFWRWFLTADQPRRFLHVNNAAQYSQPYRNLTTAYRSLVSWNDCYYNSRTVVKSPRPYGPYGWRFPCPHNR